MSVEYSTGSGWVDLVWWRLLAIWHVIQGRPLIFKADFTDTIRLHKDTTHMLILQCTVHHEEARVALEEDGQ